LGPVWVSTWVTGSKFLENFEYECEYILGATFAEQKATMSAMWLQTYAYG